MIHDENMLMHIIVIHSERYQLPIQENSLTMLANPVMTRFVQSTEDEFCKKEPEKHTLYITDMGKVCTYLREQDIPVLALLQEYNQEENFSATPYAVECLEEIPYDYLENIWKRFQNLPWTIGETSRCIIREITLEDSQAIKELYEQEEIRKFLKQEKTKELSEPEYIKAYIKKMYGFYEFGIWMIVEKKTGTIIGQAGFEMKPDTVAPQLGYVIHPNYQGQGYAYEVCSKILEIAKEEYYIEKIVAVVESDNIKSIKLCEKLGIEVIVKKHFEE